MADFERKILFAGTPDIAVPLLKAVASRFNVVGVLTACDKKQGRSSALVPSPVKKAAIELGIPVLQFESLRTEARTAVKALGADTLLTFAFGKIFGPKFLALFDKGAFNVHPSKLPEFRGPSPIQATLLACNRTAAITLQDLGEKMDEGDIRACETFTLSGTETTETLTAVVAEKASVFIPDKLEKIFSGESEAIPQSGEATYCRMIEKSDAKIDFNADVLEIHAKIRAMYPWPKAYATVNGTEIFITSVWGGFEETEAETSVPDVAPGTVVEYRKNKGLGIACRNGILWVTGLQLPAKKELDFKAFINGNSWVLNAVFQ